MSRTIGKLREYETLLVLNPELTEDQAEKALARLEEVLEKMGATILRKEKQGKKKLAFEVKKQIRGNFFLLHYVGNVGVVEELERTCRNMEHVIRFLTEIHGPVVDLEAKKAEVETMLAKRQADRERAEAEAKAAEEARERAAAEQAEAEAAQQPAAAQ